MLEELSQETVTEYANEALTIQEPQGTDYTQGVKVGKTIPAKWWNWLFNAVTKRLGQSKTDAQGILSELQNTVTDAGIELDSSDNTQLSQAVVARTSTQINNYVNKKRWYYSYWHNVTQKVLPDRSLWRNQGYGVCYMDYNSLNQIQNCFVCVDGAQWYEVPVAQYSTARPTYTPSCTFFKFKDTYVLAIPLMYSTEALYYLMFTSTDATNWTPVAPFGDSGSAGYNVRSIEFFMCDDTLYALAGFDTRAGLYYTLDGVNWTFKAMSRMLTAGVNIYDTYKFGDKYLVGNATFDPTTKEFTILTAEQVVTARTRGFVLNTNTAFVRSNNAGNPGFYRVTSDGTSTLINDTLGYPSTDYKVIVKSTALTSSSRQLSFSYDGENVIGTLDVQALSTSHPCVFVNGYYYVSNQRTTDFVNWEPIPNLPQGTFIVATGFDNILAVTDSNRLLKYVSYDYANSWVPITVEPYTVDGASVGGYIQGSPTLVPAGNIYFTGVGYSYIDDDDRTTRTLVIYTISNSINRVVGHTLYLR